MNKRIVMIGIYVLILIAILSINHFYLEKNIENTSENNEEINLYQGPVPEGYDEQHFRDTGETIPKESVD